MDLPSPTDVRRRWAPPLDLRPSGRTAHLQELAAAPRPADQPNIVVVLFDDLGQGDLSCYGARSIATPRIDALGQDGVLLDSFYSSSPVCSASRFGLLTGRYPLRGFVHGVWFPSSTASGRALNAGFFPPGVRGILPDEVTLADVLGAVGYRTSLIGKWHLGDRSPSLPNDRGFDHFFGALYSNDMEPYTYFRNTTEAIPAPVDQTLLTERLTREVCDAIDDAGDDPFFVLYASPFPHDPLHAGAAFTGTSQAGVYGDCVQELDWSVGQILDHLEATGRRDDTIVIVTSDNGPWYEGSPGLARGRKGNTFDGGQRVPFIGSWPARWASGLRSLVPAMNTDLLPTLAAVAGATLPTDRRIDGRDLAPLLTGASDHPIHDELLFVGKRKVMGIRTADERKYVRRQRSENSTYFSLFQGPFLFRTDVDRQESYDVTSHEPERAAALAERLAELDADFLANPRGWLA